MHHAIYHFFQLVETLTTGPLLAPLLPYLLHTHSPPEVVFAVRACERAATQRQQQQQQQREQI
jgi:hypothetical protein